jgi:hypothetical protein
MAYPSRGFRVSDGPATEFAGKTWIYTAGVIIFGGLGILGLIGGPLFLFQIEMDARGRPAPGAGLALIIGSVVFLAGGALALFNLRSRRQPLIRIFREGVIARLIGGSSLDRVPFVPALFRGAWSILSLQGFRQRQFAAPWETFGEAIVSGPPMSRTLTLVGTFFREPEGTESQFEVAVDHIFYIEAEFKSPLHQIADSINWYHQNLDDRKALPSWNEPR